MFAINKAKFNVESSFNEDMVEYTYVLEGGGVAVYWGSGWIYVCIGGAEYTCVLGEWL